MSIISLSGRLIKIRGWAKRHRALIVGVASVCAVFTLLVVVLRVNEARRRDVLLAHRQFLKAMEREDTVRAYQLMSTSYRAKHTFTEFTDSALMLIGDDEHMQWEVGFALGKNATVCPKSSGWGWLVGHIYTYTKEKDGWHFTGDVETSVD